MLSVAFASTNRASTPFDYSCFDGNNENSDDNNICSSLKILESIVFNLETKTGEFSDTGTYHDIRRDFKNNGVDFDLNESLRHDDSTVDGMGMSPVSSTSPQNSISQTPQKKFVLLGGVLRKLKKDSKGQELCVFCKNNGQPDYVYETHRTHDVYGRVVCPHLRIYICPICKVSGDDAHTVKYCPQKPIITVEDTRSSKSSAFYKAPPASSYIQIPHRRTNAPSNTRLPFQNYRF